MSRFQPRPKALATTSNISPHNAIASSEPVARNDSPMSRQPPRLPPLDATSDRATVFLIRRTLCANLGDKGRNTPAPINELLPPLTSSNEVDLQLYALLAIIIKEFVQVWYNKITPDHIFVEEVVKVIAHCTRALEQRLRKVDLESLIFDEVPDLIEVHVEAYRVAHKSLHPPPYETNSRQIYHSICPFPALSPAPDETDQNTIQQQADNEAAYRQLLVQGVLAVLLPTEDLENDCLTGLVGQIFSEMILGRVVGGTLSEPWMLWDIFTKIAELVQTKLPKSKARVRLDRSNSDLSLRPVDIPGRSKQSWMSASTIQRTFWLVLQYAFITFTTLRFIIITIATSSSLPSRVAPTLKMTGPASSKDGANPAKLVDTKKASQNRTPPFKQPILKMKIWSFMSTVLDVDARMPWLSATISMLQWGAVAGPGEIGNTDGMVDKILSHAIQTHILDPSLLPTLLRSARAAAFPNNAPGPPRVFPSAAEALLLRRRCAQTLLSLIPTAVADVYFGPGIEKRTKELEDVLDCFGDAYYNRHLWYGVVELVLVRLMPELGEKGVEELLGERLGFGDVEV